MKLFFKQFFSNLEKLDFSIYYLTGPQFYLKTRARERLCRRPDFAAWARTHLDGTQFDLRAFSDALLGGQLFSAGDLLVVDQCHKMPVAVKREFLNVLDEWEGGETRGKALIMLSDDEKEDPSDPLEGHCIASPKAAYLFMPELTDEETLSLARGEMKRQGVEISAAVIDRAFETFSNDFYQWANWIRTLKLCLGVEGNLSDGEAIEALGAGTTAEDLLRQDLIDSARRFLFYPEKEGEILRKALSACHSLIEKSAEGEQAVALWVFRIFGDTVFELSECKAEGYSKRHYKNPELAWHLRAAAERFSWEKIKDFYDLAIEAELAIKTGRLPSGMAMREFLRAFGNAASGEGFGGAEFGITPRRESAR